VSGIIVETKNNLLVFIFETDLIGDKGNSGKGQPPDVCLTL